MPRSFRLSLALLMVSAACECGDGPPPDDTFDGNVIVGDGSIPDSDMQADAAQDAGDAGEIDAALDAGDGGSVDTGDADVPFDGGDRCSEPAVTTLTATSAAAEIDTWEGMIVEITGTATLTDLGCTELPCAPEMPCCNTCTATVSIEGVVPLLGGSCFSPAPGCSGSECAQVCRPPLLGVPRRFRGTLIDRGAAGVGLELFSVSN